MTTVAVVASAGKTLDGGLPELRRALERRGVREPLWREVAKSREAPREVRRAVEAGADVIFVWGGDGMVQRCVDALGNSRAAMAIVPAGTANLFASSVGVPRSIDAAVEIGLGGGRRTFDVGSMNGERFAVMAGIGFDARMIHDTSRKMKRVLGRLAYVWSATKNVRAKPFEATIEVDGVEWYGGDASCVLFGNVDRWFGGLHAFEDAHPDDGLLEVGIATADGIVEWARTVARSAFGTVSKSPFVHVTKGRSIKVNSDRKVLYELDGGERSKGKKFSVEIKPGALTVCAPAQGA
jgi:diacylglycerol kinase (ATP)